MSKNELDETTMLVTTPRRDVITRKGGEVSAAATLRLLIIDEVHLLNDDRGPVIETLVARTHRQSRDDAVVDTDRGFVRDAAQSRGRGVVPWGHEKRFVRVRPDFPTHLR